MDLKTIFQTVWQTLRRNPLRSFLSVFGIVIGIAAVVIVLSAGAGLQKFIFRELEAFGSDFIEIEPKVPNVSKTSTANATGIAQGVSVTSLKTDDVEAVGRLANIETWYAAVMGQAIATAGSEKKVVNFMGASSTLVDIDTTQLSRGRFYSDQEEKSLARVAVLGATVAEDLFGNQDAIGRRIKLGRESFEVIGMTEAQGASIFFDRDSMIYVPLKTAQKLLMGINHVTFAVATMRDPSREAETVQEATLLLRDRHELDADDPDKDDFAVNTATEAQEILGTVIGGVTILLVVLAAVSLIVGGVGILNIMYVSVSERTGEIGLRKAVGATAADISRQFLIEAVAITLAGGLTGVVVGIGVTALVSVGARSQGIDWPFAISLPGIFLAVIFSMGVGIIFGVAPARKAARLDPIDALRRE